MICVTSGKEVKPEPRKESRYWVIFRAASQSSTELSLLRSGAPRSNKGCWEGLHDVDTSAHRMVRKTFYHWNRGMRHKCACVCKWVCISPHPGAKLLMPAFRDAGLRIILSNMLTISENFGRAFLSFCQQSSISWCRTTGQSMGAGSLKSCSIAFITCDMWKRRKNRFRPSLICISFYKADKTMSLYVKRFQPSDKSTVNYHIRSHFREKAKKIHFSLPVQHKRTHYLYSTFHLRL